MRGRVGVILVILTLAAVAALIFHDRVAGATTPQIAAFAYGLLALMVVAGGALGGGRLGATPLRNAMIWICVILALALAYRGLAPVLPPGFGLR